MRAALITALGPLGCSAILTCGAPGVRNPTITHLRSTPIQEEQKSPQSRIEAEAAHEEILWEGESSGYKVRWTTLDLYSETSRTKEAIWKPFIENEFENFRQVYISSGKRSERKIEDCTYERDLRVLSVVGSLVSFQDEYADFCGGAHPTADFRFTTIDLAKPGSLAYAREDSTPMMNIDLQNPPPKAVKLTDYFSDQDLPNALLDDKLIRATLLALGSSSPPKTLAELSELLAKVGYLLGDSGFQLSPDFITRFSFHHLEGKRVAIRISLSPASTATQSAHQQLGLLLSIPASLSVQLPLAEGRQQGFLMSYAERALKEKTTTFTYSKIVGGQ